MDPKGLKGGPQHQNKKAREYLKKTKMSSVDYNILPSILPFTWYELPPKNKQVVVRTTDGTISMRSLGCCDKEHDSIGLWYHLDDSVEPIKFADVTHWMKQT